MQIKDVMTPQCDWIAPDANLQQAAQMMKDKDIGFIPVGENDKLIGAITDRDLVTRGLIGNMDVQQAQVRDVMTQKMYYCFEDQSVDEICQNMSDIKVRRLPVVNRDKRLTGIVSTGDLAQAQAQQTGEAIQGITSELQQNQKAA